MYNFGSLHAADLISWSLWVILMLPLSHASPSPPRQFQLQPYRPTSYWVPSLNQIAYAVLELEIQPGVSKSAPYIQSVLRSNHVNGVYGAYGNTQLNTTQRGLVFTTAIKVGLETFQAVVDTGSSDTWLARSGFQCLEPVTGDHVSPSTCRFGPLYTPARTFKSIPNQNFYINYSDGEYLSGSLGTETVSVAGITVPNQEIGVVNYAAFNGDGITSGLLGLAFPASTHAYAGTDPGKDSAATQKIYNPIFTNMYSKGLVPPLFSIALNRDGGGQLALGGLPPVSHRPDFASSPFQILQTTSPDGSVQKSNAYTLYTITTEGFTYTGSSTSQWSNASIPHGNPNDPSQIQMIVDSGTTATYLPPSAADAVNNLFNPRPNYRDPDSGFYIINCKATAPKFGVKVGMETFYIDPRDMIINLGSRCISGIAATAPGGSSVLGHSFLKNVVAVFDVGASMMRFAARI